MGDIDENTSSPDQDERTSRLVVLIYEDLRRLARRRMSRESAEVLLQPTELVHEAYLRLKKGPRGEWQNRRHFMGAAAEAMRRILIERARKRASARHGGEFDRVRFDTAWLPADEQAEVLLALDDALERLEKLDPRKALVVKLRYFVGLTIQETAEVLGMSVATVKLDWSYSRAWLHREISLAGDHG